MITHRHHLYYKYCRYNTNMCTVVSKIYTFRYLTDMVFVVMEGRGLIVIGIGGCVNARKDYIHTCRRLLPRSCRRSSSVIIMLWCDAMSGGNSSGLKRSLLRVATDDGVSGQFLLAS